ncbi:MAG: TIGR03087 family PEP-CTERM/XrtA system glycosyltransferase [Pseudomonadota bacterium]
MSKPSLLFLCHRIPYPPNKGDKIRSYNLLRWLAQRYDVSLGAFVDDEADWAHTDRLDALCARTFFAPMPTGLSRLWRAGTAVLRGDAISAALYRHKGMTDFVGDVLNDAPASDVLVFSSAMGVHTTALPDAARLLVDFVDVDSEKWRQYSGEQAWPMSWLYRREARTLFSHDLALAHRAAHNFFVSEKEAALFRSLAPSVASTTSALANGVDAAFFDAKGGLASPFKAEESSVVFTGAMDYWPNADAVVWFVEEVMPHLRERASNVTFYIVGANPTARVRRLQARDIVVTGTVDDIRPYIGCADVIVAPLRVARGVQNKVLEAMAMSRRVVTTPAGAEGIDAVNDEHYCVRETGDDMAVAIEALLGDPSTTQIGRAARDYVLEKFGWEQCLSVLSGHLDAPPVDGPKT